MNQRRKKYIKNKKKEIRNEIRLGRKTTKEGEKDLEKEENRTYFRRRKGCTVLIRVGGKWSSWEGEETVRKEGGK